MRKPVGRGYARQQRERHIQRRVRILKDSMHSDEDDLLLRESGRLDTYNLACQCPGCRDDKYRDRPRHKEEDDGWR